MTVSSSLTDTHTVTVTDCQFQLSLFQLVTYLNFVFDLYFWLYIIFDQRRVDIIDQVELWALMGTYVVSGPTQFDDFRNYF